MGDKSREKRNEIEAEEEKNKNPCCSNWKEKDEKSGETSNRLKRESKKLSKSFKDSSLNGNLISLLSIVEKNIKDLYETISKKMSHFAANDLKKLKNLSKDELIKLNASLSEYKEQMEKLSEEKIKRINEVKNQLQTRIITTEELNNFIKYLDQRIVALKKITENIIKKLLKNEAANNFVKDLGNVVTDYGKKMTSALNDFYKALKKMAENLKKSKMENGENLEKNIGKTCPEVGKTSSVFNKMFKTIKIGSTNFHSFGETSKKVSLPITRLKEKIPTLNIGKHFNSHTTYGRANVAKATYAGVLLCFLYWTMRKTGS